MICSTSSGIATHLSAILAGNQKPDRRFDAIEEIIWF